MGCTLVRRASCINRQMHSGWRVPRLRGGARTTARDIEGPANASPFGLNGTLRAGVNLRQTDGVRMRREKTLAVLAILLSQPGCIVVGGYSDRGGWFFWPGGLMIGLVLLLLFFMFGRRRRL